MRQKSILYPALVTLVLLALNACQGVPKNSLIPDGAKPASAIPSAPDWTDAAPGETTDQQVLITTKFIELTHPGGTPLPTPYTKQMKSPEFQQYMRTIAQRKGADILSAPSVVAKEGQTAKIEVIREFTYLTGPEENPEPSTVPLGVTNILRARPTDDPAQLALDIFAQVTEFEGFAENKDGRENPLFSSREVSSTIELADGDTVLFGGLIKEDIVDVEDKVPLLGHIPLLGRAFTSHSTHTQQHELIITITTRRIDKEGNPLTIQR